MPGKYRTKRIGWADPLCSVRSSDACETVLSSVFASLVPWYNSGYTLIMKTAISIPELFESAEQFARGRGMSRSEL